MRKLLCFILAFTMLFTSVAASAAMSADKIPEFLDKAGIVKAGSYADETKVLTRGEFVKMISKLVTINNMQNLSEVQVFKDIPMDSELFDATTLLNKLYFIVGDGNGYFEPEAPITAEAACKILVHLLGDQYFAQYYGGYIPAAAAKGLLNGVEIAEGQAITVKAAMKLIYNTLVADISNSNMYDGNATNNNPEEMFMSKRLGIYTIKGTVTDDGVTGLTGATLIDSDQLKIDQYVFTNETGMSNLLGYAIEGFYKHDKELGENILIYAYVDENKTDVIEIADIDIIRYNNCTYEYYKDEAQTEEDELYLNQNFRLIYNGHAYTRDTSEATFTKTVDQMLKPLSGWVKLIDTDGDSYYDLVVVKDYEIVVLASVDIENYVVYGDPKYTNIAIDLKGSEDNMVIKNAEGSKFEFNSFDRGDVLSVAQSADGKCVEIMYSNTKIKATLGSTDGDYYYINDEEYIATKAFKDYAASLASTGSAIAAGVYGEFYFTFDNKIAYFKNEAEIATKVGMLGKLHYKSAMDDELTFLILTSTNSLDTYKAAKKVNVDGVIYKDMYALYNYLEPFKTDLIRYRLNADGEINWIDTPYILEEGNPNSATESEDTLHIMKGGNDVTVSYKKETSSFDGLFITDSDTIPFVYAVNADDPIKESYATTLAAMGTSAARHITAYSTDTSSMYAEYVRYDFKTIGNTVYIEAPTTGVVLKIKDAINDEGDVLKKLVVTTNGTHYTDIYAKPEALICPCGLGECATRPLEVGVGDIIQYAANDEVITETIICYDYSQKKHVSLGNMYHFGVYENGIFTTSGIASGHNFNKANIDSWTTNSNYGSGRTTVVLPVNYINRIQKTAAEFAFDFWPFADWNSLANGYLNYYSSSEVRKIYGTANMYVIEVNAQNGTFTPVRMTDLKTYNDGAGVKEGSYMIWKSGMPNLLIYYK